MFFRGNFSGGIYPVNKSLILTNQPQTNQRQIYCTSVALNTFRLQLAYWLDLPLLFRAGITIPSIASFSRYSTCVADYQRVQAHSDHYVGQPRNVLRTIMSFSQRTEISMAHPGPLPLHGQRSLIGQSKSDSSLRNRRLYAVNYGRQRYGRKQCGCMRFSCNMFMADLIIIIFMMPSPRRPHYASPSVCPSARLSRTNR